MGIIGGRIWYGLNTNALTSKNVIKKIVPIIRDTVKKKIVMKNVMILKKPDVY